MSKVTRLPAFGQACRGDQIWVGRADSRTDLVGQKQPSSRPGRTAVKLNVASAEVGHNRPSRPAAFRRPSESRFDELDGGVALVAEHQLL